MVPIYFYYRNTQIQNSVGGNDAASIPVCLFDIMFMYINGDLISLKKPGKIGNWAKVACGDNYMGFAVHTGSKNNQISSSMDKQKKGE